MSLTTRPKNTSQQITMCMTNIFKFLHFLMTTNICTAKESEKPSTMLAFELSKNSLTSFVDLLTCIQQRVCRIVVVCASKARRPSKDQLCNESKQSESETRPHAHQKVSRYVEAVKLF